MLLAALLDLGDPRFTLENLRELAERLLPGEAKLECVEEKRGALRGLMLSVETPESVSPPHRHFSDLLELLERADLSERARERATGVLRRIAEAESQVHGIPLESVHFHEVGAVDTLIDVAGAVYALELLEVDRVFSTPPLIGDGTVRCAHGEMPVPAPGTAEILKGMPILRGGGGERLTPTGAALLAELAEFSGAEQFCAERVGYGAGARDPKDGPPNLVRVQLGQCPGVLKQRSSTEVITQFEFHLDDATGEEIAFALERLREADVLDVWTSAVQMKKGRPGVLISGLISPDQRDQVERIVFEHSTTLGVRFDERSRSTCERDVMTVELEGQPVRVKRRFRPHALGSLRASDLSPEYEDLARISLEKGLSIRELEVRAVVIALAESKAREQPTP